MGAQGLSNTRSAGIHRLLLAACAIVVVDQLTKVWVVAAVGEGSVRVLGDFLQIQVTRNPGAAFSTLTGAGRLIGVIAIGIVVVVVAVLPRLQHRFERVALVMVLGGAAGNLIDRILRGEGILDGAVVDFVDFSFFPAFNVADASISIGVALLVLMSLFPSVALQSPADGVVESRPADATRGDG